MNTNTHEVTIVGDILRVAREKTKHCEAHHLEHVLLTPHQIDVALKAVTLLLAVRGTVE